MKIVLKFYRVSYPEHCNTWAAFVLLLEMKLLHCKLYDTRMSAFLFCVP